MARHAVRMCLDKNGGHNNKPDQPLDLSVPKLRSGFKIQGVRTEIVI